MLNSTQKGIKYSLEPKSAILLTSVLFLQVRLVHVHLNTIPCGSNGKEFATVQEIQVQSLGQEAPLEKGMAPLLFLPGEFHGQRSLKGSMGSQRVGHD